MSQLKWKPLSLVAACGLLGCLHAPTPATIPDDHHDVGPVPLGPGKGTTSELKPVVQAPARAYNVSAAGDTRVDMRLLVIAADGSEECLGAIKGALDYLGMPYDVWIGTQRPGQLVPSRLADGNHGFYQGVILTTGDLDHDVNGSWTSALSQAEWDALTAYEGAFAVRQVTWYTYPDADHGFNPPDVKSYLDAGGLDVRYTSAGAAVFPYLATAGTLKIHDLFAFQARPTADTTPLLTDGAGRALAALKTYADGHQNLAFTFDAHEWSDTSWALAFNAGGITDQATDPLYATAMQLKPHFQWVSHTLTHANMDAMDYATALHEVQANADWGKAQGLPGLDPRNLITPQISGLENVQAMNAAYDAGVRWVVGDIYKPGLGNPSPNAGLWDPANPKVLVIPRVTSNWYWDVSTPAELAQEYNDRNRARWGRDLAYAEILDKESEIQLLYLLKGDADPWMFHQANLRAYDGTHSLFTDLMDRTLDRYDALASAPLLSPPLEQQATRMLARMAYNQAGLTAMLAHGKSITLYARQACSVPVTGLAGPTAASYAGDVVTTVQLAAGQTLTLALNGGTPVATPTPAPTATPTPTPTATPTPRPTATPTPRPTATPTPSSTLDLSRIAELRGWWQGLTPRQKNAVSAYWVRLKESQRRSIINTVAISRPKDGRRLLDLLLATALGN